MPYGITIPRGKTAPLLFSSLLLLLVLSGCFGGDDRTQTIDLIHVDYGFLIEFEDARVHHLGSGHVTDRDGLERAVEIILIRAPSWVPFNGNLHEEEIQINGWRDLQVAVTPDLKEAVAYRISCLVLHHQPDGGLNCEWNHVRMEWLPEGTPWFFGLSDMLISTWNSTGPDSEGSKGPAIGTDQWQIVDHEGAQVATYNGENVSIPSRHEVGVLFQRHPMLFSGTGFPEVIKAQREDDVHNVTFLRSYPNPSDNSENNIRQVLEVTLPETVEWDNHLPGELEANYHAFPWSEAWAQIEDQFKNQETIVLRGGIYGKGNVTATSQQIVLNEMWHQTVIVADLSGNLSAFHIERRENLTDLDIGREQLKEHFEDEFVWYQVEEFTLDDGPNVTNANIPSARIPIDRGAAFAEKILEQEITRFRVYTEIERETATGMDLFYAAESDTDLLHTIRMDAHTGHFKKLSSTPDKIDQLWSF